MQIGKCGPTLVVVCTDKMVNHPVCFTKALQAESVVVEFLQYSYSLTETGLELRNHIFCNTVS